MASATLSGGSIGNMRPNMPGSLFPDSASSSSRVGCRPAVPCPGVVLTALPVLPVLMAFSVRASRAAAPVLADGGFTLIFILGSPLERSVVLAGDSPMTNATLASLSPKRSVQDQSSAGLEKPHLASPPTAILACDNGRTYSGKSHRQPSFREPRGLSPRASPAAGPGRRRSSPPRDPSFCFLSSSRGVLDGRRLRAVEPRECAHATGQATGAPLRARRRDTGAIAVAPRPLRR